MKKNKLTLSQLGDILALLSSSLLSFMLLRNIYFALATLLLSSFIVIPLLLSSNKIKYALQCKLASYTFFSSFLKNISCSENVKRSYENAAKYLSGYTSIVPYEDLQDTSLPLYRYQNVFQFILEKARNNEALLLFYLPMIDEIKTMTSKLEKDLYQLEKKKNETIIFLLVLELLFALVLFFLPLDGNIFTTFYFLVPACVLLSLPLSITHLIYHYQLKGENDHA